MCSIAWQIYTWKHAQRFDVRVRIESTPTVLGGGKYEIVVVVENLGATDEAVRSIVLRYAEHAPAEGGLRHPSLHDPNFDRQSGALPPRHHVRRTYDLLGVRFLSVIPTRVTAYAQLESGAEWIASDPHETSMHAFGVAMLGRERTAYAELLDAERQSERDDR